MQPPQVVAELARNQRGVLTRTQLRDRRVPDHVVRHLLACGWLQRFDRNVLMLAGAPGSWEGRLLAHCLSSRGYASHRSAAYLWRLGDFRPGRPEITVANGSRYRRDHVRVHQSTDVELAGLTRRSGIPVTGLRRTLLDLGAVVPESVVETAVDEARRRYKVSWPELLETLVRHARRGRNGVGAFRAVLEDHYGQAAVPDSDFERIVERLLSDAGLPAPTMQHEVTTRPSGSSRGSTSRTRTSKWR